MSFDFVKPSLVELKPRISVIGVRADYAPSYQFTQDAEQTRAVPVTIALDDQLPGGLPVDLDLVPCRTTQ